MIFSFSQIKPRISQFSLWFVGVCCATTFIVAPSAIAGDYVSDEWQFTVAPYFWALETAGEITVDGKTADADMGFDDILDDLNFGLMGEFEARKNRWGLIFNIFYSQLENDTSVRLYEETVLAQDYKLNIEKTVWISSFGGYYRLGPWALDSEAGESGPLLITDLMAGVRYTNFDVSLDLKRKAGIPIPGLPAKITDGENEDWFDPVVGIRALFILSPVWSLSLSGDIGGFGVGSDEAWQAAGIVGYDFKMFGDIDAQVFAGYRALYQDYSKGSGADKFRYDMTLKGPVFGLGAFF